MRKLKIYLDTSVISHLDSPDVPDKQSDTLQLWEEIKAGRLYEVYLSPITLEELENCPEPKRGRLFDFLGKINFNLIEEDSETLRIARKFIENGTLTEKSFDDCRHISCALIAGCDIIVSWNFKHIVNLKTISGVKSVAVLERYREINIYTPSIVIGGEKGDE